MADYAVVSRRVRAIEYDHIDEPDGDDVTRRHEFRRGVELRALKGGNLLLVGTKGELWQRFPR